MAVLGSLVPRFWKKTDKRSIAECWPFDGTLSEYGSMFYKKSTSKVRAHRVSYAIHFSDPGELFVCHRCDNPGCVNPAHLFLGTNLDNMRDCANKGRTVFQQDPTKKPFGVRNGRHTFPDKTARGSRVNTAKLTESQVIELRRLSASGMSSYLLADRFGITPSTARKIVRGIYWRHVACH